MLRPYGESIFKGGGMGSYYSLIDRTTDDSLIDCPGREIMKVAWYFDDPDTESPEIRIFTRWEHYPLSDVEPSPQDLDAAMVDQDLVAILETLSRRPDGQTLGRTRIEDWVTLFSGALDYVRKHATHTYASRYFE